MHSSNNQNAISRFFSGLAEYTFQTRLGVVDPQLVEYVSDMLTRFVRNDHMFRVRDKKGRPLVQVTEMMLEAQQRMGDARRDIHRHIGDFTLFWTGLYPESVEKKKGTGSLDHLIDYCEQGKRAYWIASTIDTEDGNRPSAEVLGRLSSRFELCAYGLREIRREWEHSDDDDAPAPIFFFN
jgi:hypothetical protein